MTTRVRLYLIALWHQLSDSLDLSRKAIPATAMHVSPSSWNHLPLQLRLEVFTLPLSLFGNAGRLSRVPVIALTWVWSASESLSGAIQISNNNYNMYM